MPDDLDMQYVAPVANRVKNANAAWRKSPEGMGQKIFQELDPFVVRRAVRLVSNHTNENSTHLLLSPESMFPFPLNHYPEIVRLWSNVIPDESHFLLGGIYEKEGRSYQSVFWLHRSLIINVYVKKSLTPFVEKIPEGWRCFASLREGFLANTVELSDGAEESESDCFDIGVQLRVVPRVCLEFFFVSRADFDRHRTPDKTVLVAFFANDSWFCPFFRSILYRLVCIKQAAIQLPVVYVGHFGMEILR